MDPATCQACGAPIQNPGHGRRYCEICPPPAAAVVTGPLCPHGVSIRASCERCEWEGGFFGRLYALMPDETVPVLRRFRRRELARLRRRDVEDDERQRRMAVVREHVGIWIGDLRTEANWDSYEGRNEGEPVS